MLSSQGKHGKVDLTESVEEGCTWVDYVDEVSRDMQEVGEPVVIALAYCLKVDIKVITAGGTRMFDIHPQPTGSITLAYRPGHYCSVVPSKYTYMYIYIQLI